MSFFQRQFRFFLVQPYTRGAWGSSYESYLPIRHTTELIGHLAWVLPNLLVFYTFFFLIFSLNLSINYRAHRGGRGQSRPINF